MLSRFLVETLRQNELGDFFSKKYIPSFDFPPYCKQVFDNTYELAFDNSDASATIVVHACYDQISEQYCAIMFIGTTTAIDDRASIAIEYIFIEPSYRKQIFTELNNMKLSEFLLLDYALVQIGLSVKEKIGINFISLVPINEKVRVIYEDMGFTTIKNSGTNQDEDWMIFNI